MALIVEDGTGRADAQVFCSVAYADAWHLARGATAWGVLTNGDKETALVRAAQYMQQVYRLRWRGNRKIVTQALAWPRYDVPMPDGPMAGGYGAAYYDDDVVPIEVQQANAELALKAATGDLLADVSQRVKREKVDVIEVEYADGSSPVIRYMAVDGILAPLLRDAGGATISLSRA